MDTMHYAAIQTDRRERVVIRLEGTVRAHAAKARHLADAGTAAVALRADVAAGAAVAAGVAARAPEMSVGCWAAAGTDAAGAAA